MTELSFTSLHKKGQVWQSASVITKPHENKPMIDQISAFNPFPPLLLYFFFFKELSELYFLFDC